MRKNAQIIEILLAGPADVAREIAIARDEITRWNAAHSRSLNAILEPVHWNTHAFPEVGDRPQGLINRQIVDCCDLLIAIFWKALGTPTGVAESGTIEEIERFRNSEKPVMVYFSEASIPQNSDLTALKKLQHYRSNLSNTLYSAFKTGAELRKKLSLHLPQAVGKVLNSRNPEARKIDQPDWLAKKLAALDKIEIELDTTGLVHDLSNVVKKLKPFLLDCCGLSKLSKIKPARSNLQLLIERSSQLQDYSFSSGTVAHFQTTKDSVFRDIRIFLEHGARIGQLDDWEIARYEDLKEKYIVDVDETAWNWRDEAQCQCENCNEFRRLRLKLGDDVNSKFRGFILQLVEESSHDKSSEDISVSDWIRSRATNMRVFEVRFRVNGQLKNARAAGEAACTFESVLPHDLMDQINEFFDEEAIEQRASKITSAVSRLRDLLGP
jgi:hypothetical protein